MVELRALAVCGQAVALARCRVISPVFVRDALKSVVRVGPLHLDADSHAHHRRQGELTPPVGSFAHQSQLGIEVVEQADFGVDIQCSAIMEFPDRRHLSFQCSTQLDLHQRMVFQGTTGRIEVKVPFNPMPGANAPEVILYDGPALGDDHGQRIDVEDVDQYVLEVDAMNRAILGQESWAVPRSEIMAQARAIDMVFKGQI